jgi:hypothetical protein
MSTRLSTSFTYVFPTFVLLFTSLITISFFLGNNVFDVNSYDSNPILLILVMPFVLYFIFRILVTKIRSNIIIYTITTMMVIILGISSLFYYQSDSGFDDGFSLNSSFALMAILSLLYFWTIRIFRGRCTASINEKVINYKNLFGQKGEINLKFITMLEQDKNPLSLLRYLRFLNFSKKTEITFKIEDDEEDGDYVIYFFPRSTQKRNSTFELIIQKAKECGNDSIRQYFV